MSVLRTAAHALPRIELARSAVFVCDIQEKFRPAIWNYPLLINTARKTLEAALILDIPVFVTEQHPQGLGPTVSELRTVLDKFPNGRVATEPKTRFSMAIPPGIKFLADTSANGAHPLQRDVLIVGIESHVCVLQTVLDLLELGHNVFVLADGVSSCNQGEIGVALGLMRQAGAVTTTSESIIFQLLADAKHPKFKQVLSIIKQESENTATAVSAFAGIAPGRL